MKKEVRFGLGLCCLAAIAILFVLISFGVIDKPEISEVNIFADINECQSIDNLDNENRKITKYDSPSRDKYINGVEYVDFYAVYYASDALLFEIYAYQFESEEAARQYYRNATGKDPSAQTDYSERIGIVAYEIAAINGDKAYTLHTSRSDAKACEKMLSQVFSIRIE